MTAPWVLEVLGAYGPTAVETWWILGKCSPNAGWCFHWRSQKEALSGDEPGKCMQGSPTAIHSLPFWKSPFTHMWELLEGFMLIAGSLHLGYVGMYVSYHYQIYIADFCIWWCAELITDWWRMKTVSTVSTVGHLWTKCIIFWRWVLKRWARVTGVLLLIIAHLIRDDKGQIIWVRLSRLSRRRTHASCFNRHCQIWMPRMSLLSLVSHLGRRWT